MIRDNSLVLGPRKEMRFSPLLSKIMLNCQSSSRTIEWYICSKPGYVRAGTKFRKILRKNIYFEISDILRLKIPKTTVIIVGYTNHIIYSQNIKYLIHFEH